MPPRRSTQAIVSEDEIEDLPPPSSGKPKRKGKSGATSTEDTTHSRPQTRSNRPPSSKKAAADANANAQLEEQLRKKELEIIRLKRGLKKQEEDYQARADANHDFESEEETEPVSIQFARSAIPAAVIAPKAGLKPVPLSARKQKPALRIARNAFCSRINVQDTPSSDVERDIQREGSADEDEGQHSNELGEDNVQELTDGIIEIDNDADSVHEDELSSDKENVLTPPVKRPAVTTASGRPEKRQRVTFAAPPRTPETPTPASRSHTRPSSEPSSSATPATPTPETADTKNQPRFAENKRPGVRAKASDYDAKGQAIILSACHEYEARVIGRQPFPTPHEQTAFVDKAWKNANKLANSTYEITPAIVRIVKSRGSRIRGELVKVTRTKVPLSFGFSDDPSAKAIKTNRRLYTSLMKENAYLFKDVNNLRGIFEHKIILTIFQAIAFQSGPLSPGVQFERMFNPVSLETMALILTQVHFCLKEWSTGAFVKDGSFTEATNLSKYKSFLKDLQEWSDLSSGVTAKIRKRVFEKSRTHAGIENDTPFSRHITDDNKASILEDLEGRTGETESEAESSDNEWSLDAPLGPLPGAVAGVMPSSTTPATHGGADEGASGVPASGHA